MNEKALNINDQGECWKLYQKTSSLETVDKKVTHATNLGTM